MRITVLILGFGLGAVMFAQTVLVYGLSNVVDDTDSGRAASAGVGMVLLWLFAIAFVFGIPGLSVLLFLIAGFVGIGNAEHFPDLQVWGIVSLALAGLSVICVRQAQDKEPQSPVARTTGGTGERDFCPSCGAAVAPGTSYCSSCGRSLGSLACPSCAKPVVSSDAFCGHCGEALLSSQYPDMDLDPTQVEQPQRASRPRVPLLLAVCVFVAAHAGVWFRTAGTFGLGNYLGIVAVVGILGWTIYWVRKNGRGGLALPEPVWSALGRGAESEDKRAGADSQSTLLFPVRVVTATLLIAAIGSFVISGLDDRYRSTRVVGDGMEPTLPNGNLVTLDMHAYDTRQPSRGDLILYEDAGSMGQSVKRLVGLPGERVTIEGGVVNVNGEPMLEPYVDSATRCDADDVCDVVLGDDELFVLGDNRANSSDSRAFGPIDRSRVRARITSVFWPPAFPWDRTPLT